MDQVQPQLVVKIQFINTSREALGTLKEVLKGISGEEPKWGYSIICAGWGPMTGLKAQEMQERLQKELPKAQIEVTEMQESDG